MYVCMFFVCMKKAGHTELFSKLASVEAKEWSAYQVHIHTYIRHAVYILYIHTYKHKQELISSAGFFHRRKAMACLNLQGKYPAEVAFQAG